jgi:hypothetical protein
MNDSKSEYSKLTGIAIILTLIVCIPLFCFLYYNQERATTTKLEMCSFYTVANPVKMSGIHTLYLNFYYENELHTAVTSVGAGDVGYLYTRNSIFDKKYWIQVSCDDLTVFRVNWKAQVPDTLQISPNGWKEIPHGLWSKYDDD